MATATGDIQVTVRCSTWRLQVFLRLMIVAFWLFPRTGIRVLNYLTSSWRFVRWMIRPRIVA